MKVTLQQVEMMFAEMSGIYFNQMPNNFNQLNTMINIYFNRLKEYDSQHVENNFNKHLSISSFFPTIADLVKQPVAEYRIPVPSYEETTQRRLMLETKVETVDADFMERIKREAEQKLKEGRKAHEQRITKLFEQ